MYIWREILGDAERCRAHRQGDATSHARQAPPQSVGCVAELNPPCGNAWAEALHEAQAHGETA